MPRYFALEYSGDIATVVLTRVEALNALRIDAWRELAALLDQLSESPGLRAIVVRSATRQAFSSGVDLKELAELSPEQVERFLEVEEEALYKLENIPVPSLAVISGWALGAGLGLAVACDCRIADTTARLGLPVARYGLMLSSHMLQRFVALIGPARTKELLYRGRWIDAHQAERWGLVNVAVPPEILEETVQSWLRDILQGSASAIRAAKRAVNLSLPVTISYGTSPVPPYFVDPEEFQKRVSDFVARKKALQA